MFNWILYLKKDLKCTNSDLETLITEYLQKFPASIADNIDCDMHSIARWDRSCTLPRNRIVREALVDISSSEDFGNFFIPTQNLGLNWLTAFLCNDFSKRIFDEVVLQIQFHNIPGFNYCSNNAKDLIKGIHTTIFIKRGVIQQFTPNFFAENNINLELVVAKMRNGCNIDTISCKRIKKDAIIAGLQEVVRQLLSFQ